MELVEIWSTLRGVIRDTFTFSQIKELAGASGLPVQRLAHLQQRSLPQKGASKSELLDAISTLIYELEDANRSVEFFIKEMITRKPLLAKRIDETIQRFGWFLEGNTPCPTALQIDSGTVDFREDIQDALSLCVRRYRDGDYSGAVTCICGAIDTLTEELYHQKQLGNPHDDSYQQRITRAFSSFEDEFKSDFVGVATIDTDELTKIWHNYRGSVNQAAYVLGSFRRNISDAHGLEEIQKELVQKAVDCATFIIRSMLTYL